MRKSPLIPFFFAVLVAPSGGCRPPADHGTETPPKAALGQPQATPAGSSAPPASADACSPSEDRCLSDDVARTCEAGARWVEKSCEEGSFCLAGACLPLRTDDGRALERASLLAPHGEGWLDAWSAAGPWPGPLVDGQAGAAGDAGAAPNVRAICAKDGYVSVHEKPQSKKGSKANGFSLPNHFVLSGHLVVGRPGRYLLTAGVAGRVRISIAGRPVLDAARESDPAPFRDEMRVPVELERGVSRVVVLVEQSDPVDTGFWLRIRTQEGLAPADLLFAPDPAAPCAPNDLLRADITKSALERAFGVDVRPSWAGLGPRTMKDLPFAAELAPDEKSPGRPIGEGVVKAGSIGAQDGTFALTIPLEKAGNHELRLRLGEAPGAARKTTLVYRPRLHEQVVALAAERQDIESSAAPRGDKDSLIWHIDELEKNIVEGDPDISWIKRQIEDAQKLVAALEKSGDPYAERKGVVRRAYRSPLDGRYSPYVLYVPGAYKPKGKPLPLVVAAHGLGNRPEIALRVVVGEAPESGFNGQLEARHMPGLPDLGAFIVAPNQFGNAGQRHLGEDDALRVIAEVRAHYPIDERRISVTGYSLGGTVAFFLPLHYPDLFSASAPLCGYPNLLGWDTIRKPPHTPWEDVLIQKRYILNWAENGQYVPLFMVHGGKDDPTRSQIMADRYRALGYPHKLDVQEDLDHNVWDYAYEDGDMVAQLKSHKRPKTPDRVRFVTGEWRYDRSHWVRFGGFETEGSFADIDARFSKKDGAISVKTRNVESFALDLAEFAQKKEIRVVVDEKPIDGPFGAETVWFVKQNDSFARASGEPSRAGRKRAGVSGPLDDIDRHPKIIVYGTQDPAETEANRIVAEHFASFDTFAARFPVKSDVEITDDEMQQKSLVLVGSPRTNRVLALFADALPARFEENAITFRGKRYEGDDVGLSFIHPHPKNPAEYVVVHAGVHAAGTLASRHLPRFSPDFLVYDGRITVQRGGHLLDRREVIAGGYFGIDWK